MTTENNESPPSPKGLSSEIGPALFPDASSVGASIAAPPGLLKSLLFGVQPPNSHSTLVSSRSFAKMDFVGGEEDAHDAWRDKYNAHRRASLDEGGTGTGTGNGTKGGGGGGGGGDKRSEKLNWTRDVFPCLSNYTENHRATSVGQSRKNSSESSPFRSPSTRRRTRWMRCASM